VNIESANRGGCGKPLAPDISREKGLEAFGPIAQEADLCNQALIARPQPAPYKVYRPGGDTSET